MSGASRLLLFAWIVSWPCLLSADYDAPAPADVATYLTAIVDATATGVTDKTLHAERVFAVRNQIGYYFTGAGSYRRSLLALPPPDQAADAAAPSGSRGRGKPKTATLVLTVVDFSPQGHRRTKELLTITLTRA